MKFFKELFKKVEVTQGYVNVELASINDPYSLILDKHRFIHLPHDVSVGEARTEKGIQYICVREGADLSGMGMTGIAVLKRKIRDSKFCFYQGVDLNLNKDFYSPLDKVQKSLWVEEPVYSFVQTFLNNPKRFKVSRSKKGGCIVDSVTGNTFERVPGHPMLGPLWSYPGLEFIGRESLDWAGEEIRKYYGDRARKMEEINAVRKRKKWMKDYVVEGFVRDGE